MEGIDVDSMVCRTHLPEKNRCSPRHFQPERLISCSAWVLFRKIELEGSVRLSHVVVMAYDHHKSLPCMFFFQAPCGFDL